jgi:hypothetical protein
MRAELDLFATTAFSNTIYGPRSDEPWGAKPIMPANDRWRILLRLSALGALDLPAWHIGLDNDTSARLRILLGKDQVHAAR